MDLQTTALGRLLSRRTWIRTGFLALSCLLLAPGAAMAAPPKPDLADIAAGSYRGDVISDARGQSKSDVSITVVKVGPNQVRVTSNYARLPAFTVRLTKAMNTIQQASGTAVFLLDLAKRPNDLHVTVADASWAGVRAAAGAAGPAAPPPAATKPDLADIASGSYFGDVISDARGSSQSGVTITVSKVGPNQIEVSSDYPRLPTFRTRLTRAMNTIQMSGGDAVFLLDLSKRPPGLDVTVDDASWSGSKR